jgi:ribosomal protein S18 acetylase RimI-like enzyme
MILSEGAYDVPSGHIAAVVTYLELANQSVSDVGALPSSVTIAREKMTNDAYRALFRSIGAPWLWTSRLAMDEAALEAILTNPAIETWIVRQNGTAIGLIELDFSVPDVCELAFFGIVQQATGQGLGGAMMAVAKSQAVRDGRSLFTVHTCSLDDPRALGFYRKAGFVAVKRSIDIFADPRLNGTHSLDAGSHIPCLK